MVSLAGASAAYPGFQQARLNDNKIESGDLEIQGQRDALLGQNYLVNTIKAFQQQQVPGAMPMSAPPPMGQAGPPPTPPMPGQPSVPMAPSAQAAPQPSFNDRFAAAGAGSGLPRGAAPPTGMPPGGAQSVERPQIGQQYDWRQMAQMVIQANPNAKPGGVIAALNIAMPKMTAQSQAEWQSIQKQLAIQKTGLDREKFEFDKTRKGDAYPDAEGEALKRFLQENPNATSKDIQTFKNGFGGSSATKNPNMLVTQKFIEEYTDRNGYGPSAEEIANNLRQARQPQGQINKERDTAATKVGVLEQVDSAIAQLEGQKKGGPSVTGLGGALRRKGGEFLGNTLGVSKDTPGSDFETKINLIKNELPRLIAGTSRISKDERDNLNKIVRGLDPFTSPEQAVSSLKYVQRVLRGAVAAEEPAPVSRSQNGQPLGKSLTEQVRASAEEAMTRRGWSREQVRRQLQNFGYDVSGF